jgi:hypothetical protein
MALAENFRQHREAFFAAVFFIASEEDDVLALAGTGFGGVSDGGFGCEPGGRSRRKEA